MPRRPALVSFAALFLSGPLLAQVELQPTSPREGEVMLQQRGGWNTTLIHQDEVGIWVARVLEVFPQFGGDEVVGLDDKGRLYAYTSYSGKWTPNESVYDGTWLGAIAQADLDPSCDGPELYTAGNGGNFYRVVPHSKPRGDAGLESREIAHVAADDIHTMVGGDLLPSSPGDEVLAFTGSGRCYRLLCEEGAEGGAPRFELRAMPELPGRVRDAVVLPAGPGRAPWIACVCRSQQLLLLRLREDGLDVRVVAREGMGLGRIALRPGSGRPDGGPTVFYTTRDDGLVLRWEAEGEEGWKREIVYAGPQGPRGVAAGRFDADPEVETIAVYGYSHRVELLTRTPEGWRVETLYVDGEKGHWLCRGELDGRNGTDELVACGFGGRMVLIARRPGYGLEGVPAVESHLRGELDPDPSPSPSTGGGVAGLESERDAVPRVAARWSGDGPADLSPLSYRGGFETKSLLYETLVTRDDEGRIAPALASSWMVTDGGRRYQLTLRAGATFHDGAPVTADDVRIHLRRWVGLPEHDWLRASQRIEVIRALDERRLEIVLDRPYALLEDLVVLNPCAVQAPSAFDREGTLVQVVGSGPFRLEGVREDGRVLRYRRHEAHPEAAQLPPVVDLVRCDPAAGTDPVDALLRDEVDAVLSSWLIRVDPERVRTLAVDPRFQVRTAPGSCVLHLGFTMEGGPCASLDLRRRIAASIDREELIERAEAGLADPASAWAAPALRSWPQPQEGARRTAPSAAAAPVDRTLRLAAGRAARFAPRLAGIVAEQLSRAGIPVEVVADEAGAADLFLDLTYGSPYDPWTTLLDRFGPLRRRATAETLLPHEGTQRMRDLVERAMAVAEASSRRAIESEVQAELDASVLRVPLYAPRRIAIVRAGLGEPALSPAMYELDLRFLGALPENPSPLGSLSRSAPDRP